MTPTDGFFGKDFGLPHHGSADGKSIEAGSVALDPSAPPSDPARNGGYYLIPPEPLGEVARVFDIGAKKYEPRGWEKGLPWSDVLNRAYRHLLRWQRGEKFDLDDGQHNLASVAWAALVLMEYERTHPELDNVHA